MFWKASVMCLSLVFYVEIPVGGSLGQTQQTEVQAKIIIFTGSVPLLPRLMARYRSLQSL